MRIASPILIAGLLLFAAPAAAGGKLEIAERSYDAGRVEIGRVVEHAFPFKNTGDQPVTITQVRPSCGCTVSDYPPVIEPGAVGLVKLKVDTSRLHSGKQVKSATVVTDAPGAERVVLEIRLDLFTALEFLPKALVYLRTEAGRERVEKVLARPHKEGLRITGVTSSNPHIEASVAPAAAKERAGGTGDDLASLLLPRAGDYWVTIRLKETAPAGILRGDVTVHTSDPEHPEEVIHVNAVIKEPRPPEDS